MITPRDVKSINEAAESSSISKREYTFESSKHYLPSLDKYELFTPKQAKNEKSQTKNNATFSTLR